MSEIYKSEMMPTDIVFTNRLWAATEAGIIVDASQIGGKIKNEQIKMNIQNGTSEGSLEQINYDNANFPDSEYKDKYGELNAKASGFGSVAFGGLRYGYQNYKIYQTLISNDNASTKWEGYYYINDETEIETGRIENITNTPKITLNITPQDKLVPSGTTINGYTINYILNDDNSIKTMTISGQDIQIINEPYVGRTPTSAEGAQSFAAGASTHAIGDYSVALNKDTKAYQNSSMAIGGGTQAGMTEEDFFELYTLTPDKFPEPTTSLPQGNHYQKYMPVNQSVSGYTGEYCALYKYENGKLYYTHVNYANNSVFPGIYTPEECLRSNYTEVEDAQGSSYDSSYSFAFAGGALSKAYERHTFAFGSSTIAKGRNAVAFNSNTIASGLSSFATGIGPDEIYVLANGEVGARGRVSFVEGKVTDATGEAAHAGGAFTKASGDYSFAFGYRTQATNTYSMSIGESNIASGKRSFAGGAASTANGENAFVFGNNTVVNGISSTAFGSSNNIYLNSNYSFVAGINNNIQYGSQNIILGNANTIGNPSSTKGCSNNFVANSSNIVDNTSANANNTAVFGLENTAKHSGVFINGHGNKSSNIYQTVIGTYNKDNSDALLIVGNGTADADRKNSFEVLKDGIKTNRLKTMSDTDLTIYFDNNLNGNRTSSIWTNDLKFFEYNKDPKTDGYTSLSLKISGIDSNLSSLGNRISSNTTKINTNASNISNNNKKIDEVKEFLTLKSWNDFKKNSSSDYKNSVYGGSTVKEVIYGLYAKVNYDAEDTCRYVTSKAIDPVQLDNGNIYVLITRNESLHINSASQGGSGTYSLSYSFAFYPTTSKEACSLSHESIPGKLSQICTETDQTVNSSDIYMSNNYTLYYINEYGEIVSKTGTDNKRYDYKEENNVSKLIIDSSKDIITIRVDVRDSINVYTGFEPASIDGASSTIYDSIKSYFNIIDGSEMNDMPRYASIVDGYGNLVGSYNKTDSVSGILYENNGENSMYLSSLNNTKLSITQDFKLAANSSDKLLS